MAEMALRTREADLVATDKAARPSWVSAYIFRTVVADSLCALAAGLLALEERFSSLNRDVT